jgi:hypothetical protein
VDAAAVGTVVAAVVAATAAVASAWYARRSAEAARRTEDDALARKFREPILQAAFNLQTRLYNIVRQGLLSRFRSTDPSSLDFDYAVTNTLYLLGQYLCWVEILRRESQFLDPRSRESEREIADQLERVRDSLATSDDGDSHLRIFRGQQRALGEMLLVPRPLGSAQSPRWECLGYAAFVERLPSTRFDRWFGPLREDLDAMARDPALGQTRLVEVQHELLQLIEILDPEAHRTSGRLRERL